MFLPLAGSARRRDGAPAPGAELTAPVAIEREAGLARSLTQRQIVMIGLGGAIGTGLFMGSGIAIGYAGPAVLVSYLIAAAIAVVMVFSLSEMAVAHPTAGSFGVYAEMYIAPWAGFMVRYTYWFAQVIAIGGEAVAAGVFMQYWFPGLPVVLWATGFAAAMIWVNARSVANFGSFEYWFALIKVVAIVLFIIFGVTFIFGIGVPAVGLHNLTGLPGGFAPNGFTGIWFGVLIAIFSFYGIELIAVTSGEAADPATAIPAALRSMALRLFLFYFLAIGIMVAFVPWTEAGATLVTQSPFVRLFEYAGIRHVAGIMNFVVLTAALSATNTNLYLASRMLFSLSRGGFAPAALGRLNARGAPLVATVVSGLVIVVTASLSYATAAAYNYLFGIALFGGVLVWMAILVCHLRFRRQVDPALLVSRAPWFPVPQLVALVLLAALLLTMAFDTQFWNVAWVVGVPWLLLLGIAYVVRRSVLARRLAATPSS